MSEDSPESVRRARGLWDAAVYIADLDELESLVSPMLERYADLLERSAGDAAALDAVSTAIGCNDYLDPPDGGDVSLDEQVRRMKAERDALKERVEKHQKVCAGVWVPAGERNPEIAGSYLIRHANSKSATRLELMDYQRGKWLCAKIWEPTHWLDVVLPGEQRVDQVE